MPLLSPNQQHQSMMMVIIGARSYIITTII